MSDFLDWDSEINDPRPLSDYEKKLVHDQKWQEVRKIVIKRDGCCQLCGNEKNLRVHHLYYGQDEQFYNPEFLICLCEKCHSQVHELDHAYSCSWYSEAVKEAVKVIGESIAAIIDPFVIERCKELNPKGDIRFFTGPWNGRKNLNDFVDQMLSYRPTYSLDDFYERREGNKMLHLHLYEHGLAQFSRYQDMRLKRGKFKED